MNVSRGVLIMVLMVGCWGEGSAGGLRNFQDSWLIEASTARALFDQRQTPEIIQRGLMVMAGQGRLFEMPELNQRFLALEGRISPGGFGLKVAGQWEKTGTGLFVEDHLVGRFLLGRNSLWGLSFDWSRQTLGGMPDDAVLELGILWEVVCHYNGSRARLFLDWPLNPPSQSLGNSHRRNLAKISFVNRNTAAAIVLDRQPDGTPKAGLHLLLSLDYGVGFEFRADPATGSLGPGLTLVRGNLMLRTSHVIHPHLGVTHRWLLVVGKCSGGV